MMFKRSYRCIIVLIMYLGYSLILNAQNEANNWYFGDKAAISFNTGVPVVLNNSSMNTWEGCASISNPAGQLLFYTDGRDVWDRTHNTMANGTGLNGHASSTQSGVIVPKPGDPNLYYVFTVDHQGGPNGFQYSLVDMTLNGGLGDITSKNISLLKPTAEKITAVKHDNNFFVWVITVEWPSYKFHAYLVTDTGIVSTPVISNNDPVANNPDYTLGYLKTSPNGKKMAMAINLVEVSLFDFDNKTGAVSNKIQLFSQIKNYYAVEFSSDASKLYASNDGNLYQFNIDAGTPAAIINSGTIVGQQPPGNEFGAFQLGPDNKIYVAKLNHQYLGQIHSPNTTGSACNYQDQGVDLSPAKSNYGLPSFIQSYFTKFSFENTCYGDTTLFFISGTSGIDSVLWDFGDPASGTKNISRTINASHKFTAEGDFNVNLIIYRSGAQEFSSNTIKILPSPKAAFSVNDSIQCFTNNNFIFKNNTSISSGTLSFQWFFGDGESSNIKDPAHTYQSIDTFQVRLIAVNTQNGCKNIRKKEMILLKSPKVSITGNPVIKDGNPAILTASGTFDRVLWSTGDTSITITVNQPGNYGVTVFDSNGCTNSAFIQVVNLNADLCEQLYRENRIITPNGDGINDQWLINNINVYQPMQVKIYNQWGTEVFNSGNYLNDWSGIFKGKELPMGTYYYIVIANNDLTCTGPINIIR
jgi:gliding motility-associated-like protein